MLEPTILDSETTGFHGVAVLFQAAIGKEEPQLWGVWDNTVGSTLEWMEHYFLNPAGVVGFNLTFDWFHIQKMYNMLILLQKQHDKYAFPEDHIMDMVNLERDAVRGDCYKPYNALDLLLHSKKGEFQSLMNRKDIRIRRVPYVLAEQLVPELNRRIDLPDMFFSRRKDPTVRWQVQDIKNDLGEVISDLVDVVLKFAPSSSLKALAKAVGIAKENRFNFEDVELPDGMMSNEPGFAPFATAPHKLSNGKFVTPSEKDWYGRWPQFLEAHIKHWGYNHDARVYAADDVEDTRGLYEYFDRPVLGDYDSTLACMVGSVRWRGFAVDKPALRTQLDVANEDLKQYKFNWNSPVVCRKYLEQNMDATTRELIKGTSKDILEDVVKWVEEEVCEDCYGAGCEKCHDKGTIPSESGARHPAAIDAETILTARRTSKKKGDIEKLLMNDLFHPDFKIIGAKSSRMSGAGGLNAQGINSAPAIRRCFTMADIGEVLSGGDFDAFEVSIAAALYKDPQMIEDLQTGKKLHATLGGFLFDMSYDEIMATANLEGRDNKYGIGKSGLFALFYGGDEGTLNRKTGVSIEKAEEAVRLWDHKYKVMSEGRQKVIAQHTCLSQPNGIGSAVLWSDPKEYVESMFGFRRYFTLENLICKALFELANKPPKDWTEERTRVIRREASQTASGATRSALFGAAFGISSGVVRAAINHRIQSSGSTPTKDLQARLWVLQPCGVSPWQIRTMQIHDEILAVSLPELTEKIIEVKDIFLTEYRKTIPMLNITWNRSMDSWQGTH